MKVKEVFDLLGGGAHLVPCGPPYHEKLRSDLEEFRSKLDSWGAQSFQKFAKIEYFDWLHAYVTKLCDLILKRSDLKL